MANYFEKRDRFQQEREKYYREKTNTRLKYVALISIGISIILLLTMAFGFVDYNNTTAILFMRGCAGLFALIFVVLVAIIVYRVNISYFNDKLRSKQDTHDE
ncbi:MULTISPECIES: hypothetical protein [Bacteroidales]|jgi:polyferredoxin|nr:MULTISPECIES: hypothetical protein [Bacteroidales]MBJ2194106.1 hypothetical protein [Muribaculaceae bacterium]RXE68091.1 hypothetical protein ED328_09000 [Muribaculaceae bacterium Isolate-001 (NCI)]GFI39882.1 hypothetical protein IMSAGC016_01664 [Muribaculaceae bacterium]